MTLLRSDEAARELQTLAHYEIDGSFMLSQAIDTLHNETYRGQLIAFMPECEENIRILCELIRQYGGKPPAYRRDFKGYLMQGYVALRGFTSDEGVMSALSTNLKVALRAFERALSLSFPREVKATLRKIYMIIQKHYDYFDSHSTPWRPAAATA